MGSRIIVGLTVTLLAVAPRVVDAYPSGIAGRTLKSTTAGCGGGSCHGSGAAPSVTVAISGPDTVIAGQTALYSVTVTGSSGADGGVDIAARTGTLAVVSTTLKLLNSEAVHKQRVAVPSSYQFNYTAPGAAGTDTLYAVGKDNGFNNWNWAPNKPIHVITATGADEAPALPASLRLDANFPNPFNPSTEIRFELPAAGHVRLVVFDLGGRSVATLVDGERGAGTHTVRFDATGLAGGLYVYRLDVNAGTAAGSAPATLTRKMLLLK